MTTKKLELRINLGDSLPQTPGSPAPRKSPADLSLRASGNHRVQTSKTESTTRTARKSPYNSVLGPAGSVISGASVVNAVDGKGTSKHGKISELLRSRGHKKAAVKPKQELLREKLITGQSARAHIITPAGVAQEPDEEKRPIFTPANTAVTPVTLATPLRGNIDSPLKPYVPNFNQSKVPATAPAMGKRVRGSKKVRTKGKTTESQDAVATAPSRFSPTGMAALKELFDAIGKETENLTFKQMLEVKVAVGLDSHIARDVIEELGSLKSILEELSMLWKINRMDLDLLEHLLTKVGIVEKFIKNIVKYKAVVDYDTMPASSERDVTTIISTLHNLLQGSEEATKTYTTMSFLHYGDVYSFTRARLTCMKEDLSRMLGVHPTQIIYITKVSANNNGYVTVMQMPCSITKRLVSSAKKNHPAMMSLGIKGVQITGSDGLKYTQSMGYLQDKIPAQTQTAEEQADRAEFARSARTAPAGPSLPPLTRKQRGTTRVPHTSMAQHDEMPKTEAQRKIVSRAMLQNEKIVEEQEELFPEVELPKEKVDLSLLPQVDPNEAKFERRVRIARDTLTKLSKPENEEVVSVLLDQIQKLHRVISSLKRDLREKTRDLNSSQNFVQKAQKEIKCMEMRVESKAQEISQTNENLLKRVKKLIRENSHLKEVLDGKEAELEVHRQSDRENRLGGMIRIARVSRMQTLPRELTFT